MTIPRVHQVLWADFVGATGSGMQASLANRPDLSRHGELGALGLSMINKPSYARRRYPLATDLAPKLLLRLAKELGQRSTSTFVRYSAWLVSTFVEHVTIRQGIAEEIQSSIRRCQSLFVILQRIDKLVGDAVRWPTTSYCPKVVKVSALVLKPHGTGVNARCQAKQQAGHERTTCHIQD